MVRIMKKDGNRLEGIGERIAVRLTLLEEALGMTPGDPEIYGNWIASKAPEPENGAEEVGVIEGMDAVEDATTCFPRTEDGVPFCWDYQLKGFFKGRLLGPAPRARYPFEQADGLQEGYRWHRVRGAAQNPVPAPRGCRVRSLRAPASRQLRLR